MVQLKISHTGNGSMPDPDMRQEGFLLQTEVCQPSAGVKTWISITLKQWYVITQACPKSNVEVKRVNIE